jgi:hypothetical protein
VIFSGQNVKSWPGKKINLFESISLISFRYEKTESSSDQGCSLHHQLKELAKYFRVNGFYGDGYQVKKPKYSQYIDHTNSASAENGVCINISFGHKVL